MGHLKYLVEADLDTVEDKWLLQMLDCCISQNEFGATFVDGYIADRDYHKAGLFIQKDMAENCITIVILKNLLADEAITSYFRSSEDEG